MQIIKVWDLPTRLFHWLLVILVAGLWLSAEVGEMEWHQIFAYLLSSILIFRLIWGFIGSDTSRFVSFIQSPFNTLSYSKKMLKNGISPHLGHNPLGGYMVIALLLVLAVQIITGLFASDEVFTQGPLYSLVSDDTANQLTRWHKQNFNLLLVLIVIHIVAVLFHIMKGDKLLGAMFTGYRKIDEPKKKLRFASLWLALLLYLPVLAAVGYVFIWPIYSYL